MKSARTCVLPLAVLAVVLAFGVAACDLGGDPTNLPPSQSSDESSSPSESPGSEDQTESTMTAGPPELDPPDPPDGMFVDDHQGAALAAGYFLELYNHMRATGDTRHFEAMSGPDCNFCATAVEIVESAYGDGAWMEGGDLTVDMSEAEVLLPSAERPLYTVRVNATEATLTVHEADGSSQDVPGGELFLAMGMQYVADRFIVAGVGVETL